MLVLTVGIKTTYSDILCVCVCVLLQSDLCERAAIPEARCPNNLEAVMSMFASLPVSPSVCSLLTEISHYNAVPSELVRKR
jgi:hypothetical protein